MLDRRWRRLVGRYIAGQGDTELPDPLSTIPFELLRRCIPGQRNAGSGDLRNVDCAMGALYFDPPAGGFNTNDIVAELPATTENFGNIIAPVTMLTTASFCPGLWAMTFNFAASAWVNNDCVTLRPLPFDATVWNTSLKGAVGPCGLHFRGLLQGYPPGYQDVTWYIPEEWKLAVHVAGPLTDPKVFALGFVMQCILALDGEGRMQ